MLAAYGVDVLDPTVSYRRLNVLIERLPPSSGLSRDWSPENYMLANVFDALQALLWVTVKINSKTSPTKPRPLVRPTKAVPKVADDVVKRSPWVDLLGGLRGSKGVVTNTVKGGRP